MTSLHIYLRCFSTFRTLVCALGTVLGSHMMCASTVNERMPTIATTTKPTSWTVVANPLAEATDKEEWLRNLVQGQLLTLDDNWQPVCQLCTEVPSTANGKIRTRRLGKKTKSRGSLETWVDFEILPNAQWGDGSPILGRDFQLSHVISKTMPRMTKARNAAEAIAEVTLDKKHPKKFSLRLAKTDGTLWFAIGMRPVPEHLEQKRWQSAKYSYRDYLKVSTYVTEPNKSGLFSGPWMPTTSVKASQKLGGYSLVISKNVGFPRLKTASPEHLAIQFARSQRDAIHLLNTNLVDIIPETDLDFQLDSLGSDQFERHTALGTNLEQLSFNLRNPILADINLRRCVSMMINRYELANAVGMPPSHPMADAAFHPALMGGVIRLDQGQIPGILPPAETRSWYYSPATAAQLLRQSGWISETQGKQIVWRKDDQILTLELDTNHRDATRKKTITAIANSLSAGGVQVTINDHPNQEFFTDILRRLKFKFMAVYAWDLPSGTIPATLFDSQQIPGHRNDYRGDNMTGWSNRSFDGLMSDLHSEWETEARTKKIQEAESIIAQEIPFIPLFYRPLLAATSKRVKNFKLPGHGRWSSSAGAQWEF